MRFSVWSSDLCSSYLLERPSLRDRELDWPGLAQSYPSRLPDLYAGEPLQTVVRMPIAGGLVQVSAHSRHGVWRQTLDLDHAVHADGVARLWGRARIAELEDAEPRGTQIGRQTSELQSIMRISYTGLCLQKKKKQTQ